MIYIICLMKFLDPFFTCNFVIYSFHSLFRESWVGPISDFCNFGLQEENNFSISPLDVPLSQVHVYVPQLTFFLIIILI